MDKKDSGQEFLKSVFGNPDVFSSSAQKQGEPEPPLQKPFPKDTNLVKLPLDFKWPEIKDVSVKEAVGKRISARKYLEKPLELYELSFLLWATQGIDQKRKVPNRVFRTVPSAGCRHPLETYLAIMRVKGLDKGVYRYAPLNHALLKVYTPENIEEQLCEATCRFAAESAVTFIWTAIPTRTKWRFASAAPKLIALDAGHVCQNLYLACTAVEAGTCAIAVYNQEKTDELVKVDGKNEFAIYLSSVGKTNNIL